ncbi:MAG: NirD/YgiW/YdeI family stress tolerance protein [Acinetobacter populi]|jgi:uncharacterized protein (TIGR00156 family)|uniref:NirD/YgiW/YdeI family stress tolerance protein n=1 Tax=Acinetobacter populi TaxID=1582270 RepID=UPI0023547954|nr:NirD/YgiW/YdeI family stress tolerance protein [Acinetobacter populi]MCH4248774.1 NirD/YgiW/YdeI family stress tolerance protein [Acinetobacter populi]
MKNAWLKIIFLSAVFASVPAWAGDDAKAIAHGLQHPVTVAQAKKLPDESFITLTGTLVRHLQKDHYEFKDQTGTISVEIDDDLLHPAHFKPNTQVKLVGEVDTHRYKPTDIEVLQLEILK